MNQQCRRAGTAMLTLAAMLTASPAPAAPARAAQTQAQSLALTKSEYLEAPGIDILVFSNWYDGLFADSKISGVELIHQGVRTATNGDVRLSATPGQWDPIGRMVDRKIDPTTGAIAVTLEYPEYAFRYFVRAEPRGDGVALSVILPQAVPAALAGKAGFNLEFLPSAYFHMSFMADGRSGTFPLHPASTMRVTPE